MSVPDESRSSQEKKTEFLQIRISPKKKREIEQFLEEKGFRSISSFVLFCIDYYMNFGEKINEIVETQREIVDLLKKERK